MIEQAKDDAKAEVAADIERLEQERADWKRIARKAVAAQRASADAQRHLIDQLDPGSTSSISGDDEEGDDEEGDEEGGDEEGDDEEGDDAEGDDAEGDDEEGDDEGDNPDDAHHGKA